MNRSQCICQLAASWGDLEVRDREWLTGGRWVGRRGMIVDAPPSESVAPRGYPHYTNSQVRPCRFIDFESTLRVNLPGCPRRTGRAILQAILMWRILARSGADIHMVHNPRAIPADRDPLALVYTARKHAAVRTDEYLYNQLIPYIGNKRKLLWLIAEAIRRTGVVDGTFVDFFAGSSVVARLAKTLGYRVLANDWNPTPRSLTTAMSNAIRCRRSPRWAGRCRPLPCSMG